MANDQKLTELERLKAELAEKTAENERLRGEVITAKSEAMATFISFDQEMPTKELDKDGEPLYEYRIDLPPSGGMMITINGWPFYPGQTYKMTRAQCASFKEIVARSHGHEATIKGKVNENIFRKPENRVISANRYR